MMLSIRTKIQQKLTLVLLLVTLVPMLMVGIYSMRSTTAALSEAALTQLNGASLGQAKKIETFLHGIADDVLFLSRVPPIQGIIRARAGGGIDQETNSTYELWVQRLNIIFEHLMLAKPYYLQLRYLDEQGQEMVRVDFDGSTAQVKSKEQLQHKAGADYFTGTMQLQVGEIYVSPLNLNREQGKIETPYKPVIRYGTPIVDRKQQRKGIVIANVAAKGFLEALQQAQGGREGMTVLVNQAGYYLSHPHAPKAWGFELGHEATVQKDFPRLASHILSDQAGAIADKGDTVVSSAPVFPDRRSTDRYWKVVEIVSKRTIFAPIRAFTKVFALLVATVLLLAVGVGIGVSKRVITTPIQKVVMVMQALARGDLSQQDVQITSHDEIGTLAQTFRELIDFIRGVAGAAEALNRNDRTYQIVPRSPDDILSQNFLSISEALYGLVDETQVVMQAAQQGQLHVRGNVDKFQGVYAELIQGLNGMLDAVVAPITEAAAVLEQVAARHLTARVHGAYQGEYATIKTALNTAVTNLDEGLAQVVWSAEQVTTAASQISSGSQVLAQGASEQASTLEEISSSLQELASMSQQNAANAQEARSLVDNARHSADQGTTSMQRLSQAIYQIKSASDETAKIVKTIDEIAFQTNLLALNAAVEAARAGDAGKGFAVVAQEVRNLAMRSAEAAKDTARLIDQAVQKAGDGVNLHQEVLGNLQDIVGQVHQVTEVMGEIAAASEQQQQGVEQLNTAVGQLNQVTQQTAANAEEAASTAEELASQAAQMQHMVGTFQLSQRAPMQQASRPARPAAVSPARASLPARTVSALASPNGSHGPEALQDMFPFDDDHIICKGF